MEGGGEGGEDMEEEVAQWREPVVRGARDWEQTGGGRVEPKGRGGGRVTQRGKVAEERGREK